MTCRIGRSGPKTAVTVCYAFAESELERQTQSRAVQFFDKAALTVQAQPLRLSLLMARVAGLVLSEINRDFSGKARVS